MSAFTPDSKPRGAFCRRSELIAWTTWNEDEIADYVRKGKLIMHKHHENSYPRYLVESAQEIIDEIKRSATRAAK